MPTYRGSCHCRRVTFEVDAEITSVADCNCSYCGRNGILYCEVPPEKFRLLSGEDDLTMYRFKMAKHYFCRHCGCHPFNRPRSAPEEYGINVRLLAGVDLAKLKILPFDGRNWEEANRTFRYE